MNTKNFKGYTPDPWSYWPTYDGGNPFRVATDPNTSRDTPHRRVCNICFGQKHCHTKEDFANMELITASPRLLKERGNLLDAMKEIQEMAKKGLQSEEIGVDSGWLYRATTDAIYECEKE